MSQRSSQLGVHSIELTVSVNSVENYCFQLWFNRVSQRFTVLGVVSLLIFSCTNMQRNELVVCRIPYCTVLKSAVVLRNVTQTLESFDTVFSAFLGRTGAAASAGQPDPRGVRKREDCEERQLVSLCKSQKTVPFIPSPEQSTLKSVGKMIHS